MKRVFYRKMCFENGEPIFVCGAIDHGSKECKIIVLRDKRKYDRDYCKKYYKDNKKEISDYKKKWWKNRRKK